MELCDARSSVDMRHTNLPNTVGQNPLRRGAPALRCVPTTSQQVRADRLRHLVENVLPAIGRHAIQRRTIIFERQSCEYTVFKQVVV